MAHALPRSESRTSRVFAISRELLESVRGARLGRLVAGSAGVSVLMLAGVWAIGQSGGLPTPFVHLLYLPILLSAVLFKSWGSMVAGLVAGLASSPAVTASAEATGSWMVRALMFTLIGWAFGAAHALLERRLAQNRALAEKLSTLHSRTLSTFASTVDLRDKPTSGHSSRVAHNARAIGITMGLAQGTLRAVYWAGLLHDLGKIAIPERILQKPGSLTPDEVVSMRRHSDIGANLLLSVSADLRQIAEGVRSHHEKWDGSGYPRGLEGEAIPLTGRIVAVADVFEALTCNRPYRRPQPVPEVLDYLRTHSGKSFEPEIVALLEDLYWQGEIYTAASVQVQLPVEEPAIVIETSSDGGRVIDVVTRQDYHFGSKGRP
ncbi:MAG: HD-GYP domain-containing protein [Actinomycetota bacterium]